MKVTLDLGGGLKRRLWAHLLQNELEQAAFVFSKVDSGNGSVVFKPQVVYLVPPQDFDVHTGYHIELADHVRPRVIKQAWDSGTAIVEFHSHPTESRQATFSGSDLSGFEEFVPHCRWRLRGKPYLAVLVNPISVDSMAWVDDSPSPVPLDVIRLGWFRKMVPTGRTLDAMRAEGVKRGP
ncbi:MAG: hypothetical protein KatS3mg108_2599 [Isosphaeraceae bacterium]|nr:MAG: hypothetical protein KatS3mg108_2599 [Isosphaeraceae bacterium]